MRSVVLILLGFAACTPDPEVRGAIGEPCATDEDCATGTRCAHDVCTIDCASQADCPVGSDCGLADPADTGTTCYAAAYDPGIGVDCSEFALECGGADPCAAGLECHAAVECDPQAFCTASCAADTDCPPTMYCGGDAVCVRRGECESCVLDDQCGAGSVCADDGGILRCLRTCGDDGDCHQPMYGAAFETCEGGVCISASGSCIGDGAVCATCRVDHPEDCDAGNYCFEVDFTGERYCSVLCTVTSDGAGNITDDTCPPGSACGTGDLSTLPAGSYNGTCGGDPTRVGWTCYP
jgi:hypothetical protein